MVEPALERWLPPGVRRTRPSADAHLRAMLRSIPPEGYAGCCEAIRDMDLRERLERIEAPTLVVAGSDDPSTPPERVRELAAAIPGAHYVELEGVCHIANMASPNMFVRPVLEHLTS